MLLMNAVWTCITRLHTFDVTSLLTEYLLILMNMRILSPSGLPCHLRGFFFGNVLNILNQILNYFPGPLLGVCDVSRY